MSQWTHVAGIIRLDFLPVLPQPDVDQLKKIFAEEIPTGSEGPIDVQIHRGTLLRNIVSDNSNILWGYAAIRGDLRDFGAEDCGKITFWLNNVAKKLKQMKFVIRQGVVQVEVEGWKLTAYHFDEDSEKWIMMPQLEEKETKSL